MIAWSVVITPFEQVRRDGCGSRDVAHRASTAQPFSHAVRDHVAGHRPVEASRKGRFGARLDLVPCCLGPGLGLHLTHDDLGAGKSDQLLALGSDLARGDVEHAAEDVLRGAHCISAELHVLERLACLEQLCDQWAQQRSTGEQCRAPRAGEDARHGADRATHAHELIGGLTALLREDRQSAGAHLRLDHSILKRCPTPTMAMLWPFVARAELSLAAASLL